MKKSFFLATATCSLVFLACTSLQDVYVNMDELEKSADIQRIERALAFLDGDYLLHSNDGSLHKTDFATNCTAVAKDAENALTAPELQKVPQARLLALEGRAYQLAGNTSRAKNFSAQSTAAYAGDTQNIILARRLGQDVNLDTNASDSAESALLTLEKAVSAFTAGDYADAAAGFDTAFLSLDPYYREAYGAVRDKAWDLRSVARGDAALLLKDALTVSQLLSLTQDNTNLLFNYTAGKKLSANELYKRLSAVGLLSPVSQPLAAAKNIPAAKDLVSRWIAARYLWNLFTSGKENLATRYSAVYGNAASPIADVPVSSPDFDAVLGCVENELLSLPDGEHFVGDEAISAIDINAGLNKIK